QGLSRRQGCGVLARAGEQEPGEQGQSAGAKRSSGHAPFRLPQAPRAATTRRASHPRLHSPVGRVRGLRGGAAGSSSPKKSWTHGSSSSSSTARPEAIKKDLMLVLKPVPLNT